MQKNLFDLAIIGAGPAALSAAVYAARYKMNAIVIGQNPGGYVNDAHLVENWLGEKSIKGSELSAKFVEHVKNFEIEIRQKDIKAILKNGDHFSITAGDDVVEAKQIIIATGTERNKLGIKGEEEFLGKGVSYCATCDGFFFRDRTVAVIGGGDSAATSALSLADVAKKVYVIHRRDELRACPAWKEQVHASDKIECVLGAQLKEIAGENVVKKLILDNGQELDVDGVFIEIGSTPASTFIKALGVDTDEKGYIVVNDKQQTNVKNIYAAGDITTASSKLKQMIVAAAEGAVAAYNAYLDQKTQG